MSKNNLLDSDFKSEGGLWKKSWRVGDVINHTLSSGRWDCITRRCKAGGWVQDNITSYVGCSNDFASFQAFVNWSIEQDGYLHHPVMGKCQIDKDLLFPDNMSYSESTCLFVPQRVNKFVCINKAKNGLPHGVYFKEFNRKFVSQCIDYNGVIKHLGYFEEPLDAHSKWQQVKAEHAMQLALYYSEFHPKLGVALTSWADRLLTDKSLGIESNLIKKG